MITRFANAAAPPYGVLFDGLTDATDSLRPCGISERLIDAVVAAGASDRMIASKDGEGLSKLLRTPPVRGAISSYGGQNKKLERRFDIGKLKRRILPTEEAGMMAESNKGCPLIRSRHAAREHCANASTSTSIWRLRARTTASCAAPTSRVIRRTR